MAAICIRTLSCFRFKTGRWSTAEQRFFCRLIPAPAQSPPGSRRGIKSSRSRPWADGCAEVRSAIDFPHYDVDAAKDHHYVGHRVTETHVFEDGEINETRRSNAVAIRVRSTITDQIKSEFALWPFDAPVGF